MGSKISWKTFVTIGTIIACISGFLALRDTIKAKCDTYIHEQIKYYEKNIKVKWTTKHIRIGLYYQKHEDEEWELWYRHTDKKRYQPIYDLANNRYYIIVENKSMWCE